MWGAIGRPIFTFMNNKTIAAISSGMTTSGIGIIRISGDDAVIIADRIFLGEKSLSECASHTVNYGIIKDGEEKIDEAIVLIMKAPRSFTGEDVVEIQCHGGPYVMKKVLEAALSAGASLAEPGEFTKRAFLNGKIDLSQAEAVMSLIESKSDYALKASFAQLRGTVSREISDIRAKIIYDTAYLEAALDDPEHISLEGYGERLSGTILGARKRISTLIKKAEEGRVLREGIKTVILGKPNAGKSTLLNMILGEERAIVTSVPGTTRDTLEESARMGDVVLKLVDTAGIRQTKDEVEKIGVDRALMEAKEADLVFYVVDSEVGLGADEIERINSLDKAIVIYNKSDICMAEADRDIKHAYVRLSAKCGDGLEELTKLVGEMFYAEEIYSGEELMVANSRHKELLSAALLSLDKVEEGLKVGVPEDLLTVDLMDAYNTLGLITGETASEALADEIFDKFCMGK